MKNIELPLYLEDFKNYLSTIKNLTNSTISFMQMTVIQFLEFLNITKFKSSFENIKDIQLNDIRTITNTDIYSFIYYLADNNYSLSSRQGKICALTRFFDYLKRIKNQIFDQPFKKINAEKHKKICDRIPNVLSFKEAKKLLKVLNNNSDINNIRTNAILYLLLNCGLRRQEIINLNISDFDFKNNTFIILGKGNKERTGYLNNPTKEALLKYYNLRKKIKTDTDALFLNKNNLRITKDTVHESVKKAYRLAKIDENLYSVHTLRHTCATLMYKSGVDLKIIQELLGHAKIETTEIYSHVYDAEVKKAMLNNPLGKFKLNDAMNYIAS